MPISFLWLYIFKCDVCVLNHMWIKPKRFFFLFFLFAFGCDLYHLYFSKFFKLFLCEKTCFLGVFMTHFMCKLNWELNGPILKFFQLWTESFATVSRVRLTREKFREYFHESASRENFQIRFLKGISWVICFNRLSSSPKPLFNVSKSKPN